MTRGCVTLLGNEVLSAWYLELGLRRTLKDDSSEPTILPDEARIAYPRPSADCSQSGGVVQRKLTRGASRHDSGRHGRATDNPTHA